jgi:predicted AAA+ superfamily ATPase
MTPVLTQTLKRLPVVVISGLRQCGKTTLLTLDSRFHERVYRTLDDFEVLAAGEHDPEGLIESLSSPSGVAVLDEVQRCPGLLTAVKSAVDRARRPGRFVLSGSANLALMAHVSETLAGRAVYLSLHPMTRREVRGQTQRRPALIRLLEGKGFSRDPCDPVRGDEVLLGGLPPVCLEDPRGASLWLRGYVQTYVERDVRQLSQVADLVAFRTLVNLAALRTGQMLNISQLGRDAKLSVATASRYLQLLETSFLIRRLPPYLNNRGSRLIKTPKLYFTDSAVAAHLAQVKNLDSPATEPLHGALWETWVVQNIVAILEAHLPDASLSYWHEQGRHEVDLVVESGGAVWAIEIKSSHRWSESDLTGLKVFLERTPRCAGAILAYNGKSAVPLGNKLWAIPLGQLLS